MPKMKTSELQGILRAEKSDALSGMESSKLSKEREEALDMYMGDMSSILPSQPDRSKAVSTDVADTVEGLLPSLIEIFTSGDDVVQFEPVGEEDEEAAKQETDYVNHVFMQKNHGFLVLYSFMKDALLSKNGIVKAWWEKKEEEERQTLYDLPDDAYGQLLVQIGEMDNAEITEHSERVADDQPSVLDEMTGELVPVKLHDVTIVTKVEYACAKVAPVPPENFGISRRANSIHVSDADYCYHEEPSTEGKLIEQGYDKDQIQKLPTDSLDGTEESSARDTVDDTDDFSNAGTHKANRTITVTEHYIRCDYEGDGKLRLYKIVTAGAGDEILRKDGKEDIELIDQMPFAAMTPVIMTHRFFGRSMADLVADIQKIKTVLLRQLLDNAYLANNQRIEIAESHAGEKTLDDLLSNRPGGIVRTKTPGGMVPIPNQEIGSFAYPLLEYTDTTREWRTGVTRQGQGIDSNALQNQSATAVSQTFTAAQARMRLIARIFAETGIRDLFLLLHAIIRKNDRQENTVKLRNQWVAIDPRQWRTRNDMTVSVGNGTKEQQMAFIMNLLGLQKEAMASGTNLTDEGKIYNSLSKLIDYGGLKSVEAYFNDPEKTPPKEPPPNPEMEKIKLQAEADQAKAQSDAQLQREKMTQDAALEREKMAAEFALRREQMMAELDLKREGMMLNAQVKAATSPVRMGGDVG
jgi:hypothetical protein